MSTAPQFDLDMIRQSLTLLEWGPDVCAELRCLGNREIGLRHGTISGYYTEPERMAQDAAQWSGKVGGVYVVLNPCIRRLVHRANNRFRLYAPQRSATRDNEVARRRWLFVDLDPIRPSGLASTDAEHTLALERAQAVRDYLRGQGIGGLVLADSGNGGHVLVPFDRANDEENCRRAEGFLEGLAERFDDERVKVDTTTFNASRLCKLYGSMSCKGDAHATENPHRISRILEVDE